MKRRDAKRLLALMFISGFLGGILCSNLFYADYLQDIGILQSYFLQNFSADQIRTADYLWYVCRIRFSGVFVLLVFSGTAWKRPAALAFLALIGFGAGMVWTAAVMKLGIFGVILCLAAAFPHFLMYAAGYLILLWQMTAGGRCRLDMQVAFVILLLTAAGVVLEACVNPVLMQLVVNNLLR